MADLSYETHTFSPPPVAWRLLRGNIMRIVHVLSFTTNGTYMVHDDTALLRLSAREIVWAIEQGEQRGYRLPHAPAPVAEGLRTPRGISVEGVRLIRTTRIGHVEVSRDGVIWEPIDDDSTFLHLDDTP